ncbi:MAG TPA: immunoglobulin domain-containing protein, partial [Verrucomicrobiota bacterium]|nr:immunoglobulin domain-containing protein [Verrucomicrobiota bacterium]
PSILVEPEGFAVVAGGSGQLSVSAVGLKPIVYQWYRNGEAIADATGPVLKLETISVKDAGEYEVEIVNNLGKTRSQVSLLNVLEPPVLEGGLNSATVNLGDPHKFILIVIGTEPIQVEWYKDGQLIDGQASLVLDLPSVQKPDGGLYHVRLANAGGEFVSEPARLSLNLPVEIVRGLKDRTVRVGTDVVLSVEAEGARPFTYRWFFEGNNLPDETGEELVLNSIRQLQKGLYAVEVANQINAVRSEAFLNVNQGPKFTRHPLDQSVNESGKAVFKVAVSGSKPLFFQWYFNGELIDGAVEPDLMLTDVTRESAGFYSLRVRNEAGETESDSALLTVNLPLELVYDLEDVMSLAGGSAKLDVEVSGSAPVTYRWFRDGTLLEEADGAVLKLEDLSLAAAGSYQVEISNPVGTIRSGKASLDVVALPEIVQAPASLRVVQGQSVSFSVIAGGSKPLTYQWLKDGVVLVGATEPKLQLDGITISDQADYSVLVTNRGGTVESAVATLVVVLPVQITQEVKDLAVSEGSIVRFTVEADGTGPLGYQWYYGGSPIDGADGLVFEIGIVQESDRGLYQVEVRNEAGRVRSREAKLNVSVIPKLTRQVEDQAILVGSELKLQASASGTKPLTYNWYRQGALYQSGSADLLIDNITTDDAGLYQVEVVNAVGSVRGSVFELEVLEPVTVITQPEDTRANEGAVAVLKVVAAGTGPFSYQWYHNGKAVDGATGSQIRILQVEDYHRGVYEVDVTNMVGTVRSESARLKVVIPPVILAHPASYTGRKGDQLILRVAAGGSEPLTYHWHRDGEPVLESNEPVLKINSAVPTDSGEYSVVVKNTAGEATSEEAQVTIYQPVVITQQPQPARAISGETAVLRVDATGSEPLAYQWLFNNSEIAGATLSELPVANVGTANEGSYQVVISNPSGRVVSNEARLAVVQPVQILVQPVGVEKTRGEEFAMKVAVSGTQPAYQWFKDGEKIEGATKSKLAFSDLQTGDSGVYSVIISNEGGEAPSAEAVVTVYDPVIIVQQPIRTRKIQGVTAVFAVEATGSEPLTYQWRFNNQVITGEIQATLTLPNVQPPAEGSYQVVVKNPAGAVASQEVKLSLILPVEITAQPESQEKVTGNPLELRVGASGSPVIEYQWFKDGDILEDEVAEKLVIESAQVADTGSYHATVKNEAGSVTSETAKVDVYAPLEWVTKPSTARAISGDPAVFSVEVSGSQPIEYEWRFNSEVVEGVDGAELTVANASKANEGSYQVVMKNPAGSLVSEEVKLTVVQPVVILGQPEGATKLLGQALKLSVVASGSEPLEYQWSKDGQALEGANAQGLVFDALTTSDAAAYSVSISNEAGTVESDSVTITVHVPITITKQPMEARVIEGETATFTVAAEGTEPI